MQFGPIRWAHHREYPRSVMMAKTREITLTDENWKKIDELLERIPDSGFLRFCLMDEIVEKGI
jgi:hypothetical protein